MFNRFEKLITPIVCLLDPIGEIDFAYMQPALSYRQHTPPHISPSCA